MGQSTFAFLLSTLAGLSTLLGTIFIIFQPKNKESILITSLSFAAGVMLTVSISDLLPSSIASLSQTFYIIPSMIICMIGFVIGVITSMTIDDKLPDQQNHLKRVGIISMFVIILHNIPEGIATFLTSNTNTSLGITLTIAIALHNIPEGISISVPIYYATKSRFQAFIYTLISGLSEPFGAILAALFLSHWISSTMMGLLYAFIAGIMTHIALYELLPTSWNYHQFKKTIWAFLIGILIMINSHHFL